LLTCSPLAPLNPIVLDGTSADPILKMNSYKDLNRSYTALIASCVTSNTFVESSSDNVNLLLWIQFVHSVLSDRYDELLTFCNRVIGNANHLYSVDSVLTALKCLSSLVAIPSVLSKPQLGSRSAKVWPDGVLLCLCC
jgi:hypothetical protein